MFNIGEPSSTVGLEKGYAGGISAYWVTLTPSNVCYRALYVATGAWQSFKTPGDLVADFPLPHFSPSQEESVDVTNIIRTGGFTGSTSRRSEKACLTIPIKSVSRRSTICD